MVVRSQFSLREFLALRRNTALLLVALVLAGTGERLWLGFAPKYLETLGASILVIGLFDAMQTLLGAVYAYPGGWLTDRLGQRASLLLFSALSLAGYGLVLVWQNWLALLLGSFLFLAWSALSLPATFAVVASSLDQSQHTMGVGVQSLVRRVPMMLGPLAGGWLITRFGWEQGVRFALLGCIVLNLATVLFQWRMVEPKSASNADAGPGTSTASLIEIVKSFNPTLRELLLSDILIRFCERIPYAFVILWAMNHGGVSASQFGSLVAIEMVTAMLCYIPVARLADKHGQRPFVLATFLFFTLFPLSLLWAHTFAWLAVAFVVRGLKEFGEPARKALIIAHAPPRIPRPHLRCLLPHTGQHRDHRLLPGRVALEPESAGQLPRRGAVRCGGHGRFWVVCLPGTAANSTAKRRKQQSTDDLKPESTPKMNIKPLSRLSLILAAGLVLAAGLPLLRSQPAAQPLPASGPPKPMDLTNEIALLRAEVARLKGIVPDQSHAMSDVAYHFSGLWFAGQHTNWPLAQFYLDETRSHLKWAVRIIPIRKNPAGMEVDLNGIREAVDHTLLADIHKAIGNKDVVAFAHAYRLTLEGCYACHKASGKPFLRPQIPTAPTMHIINLDPEAQWPE